MLRNREACGSRFRDGAKSYTWASPEIRIGAAGGIVPTLRKQREEWGTHFHWSLPQMQGRATRYASGLRRGRRPHPRNWGALATLVGLIDQSTY